MFTRKVFWKLFSTEFCLNIDWKSFWSYQTCLNYVVLKNVFIMFVLKFVWTTVCLLTCLFECFRFCFVVVWTLFETFLLIFVWNVSFQVVWQHCFFWTFFSPFSSHSVFVCVGTAGLSAGQAGGALAWCCRPGETEIAGLADSNCGTEIPRSHRSALQQRSLTSLWYISPYFRTVYL